MKSRNLTHAFFALPTFLAFALAAGPATAADAPLEIKTEKSRAGNFGDSPVLIVPTVFVKLPVVGKVSAVKQGGGLSLLGSGGSANSVRASAHYTVGGLDKKLAQQIAGKVYDDLVSQLRAAGYTVKTYEDIKDQEVVKAATRDSTDATWGMPLEKDPSGTVVYAIAAPSDDQLFKSGMAGGVFNQFMKFGKSKLTEGTLIMPTYVIAAPQAWGETGGGYKRISATANVAPGMNLTFANAPLLTAKGAWGDVRTKEQVINIGTEIGELKSEDTTDAAGNAFSSAFSALTGSGKITRSSSNYQLIVNPETYQAAVLRGAGAFNAEVAKTAAAAKK